MSSGAATAADGRRTEFELRPYQQELVDRVCEYFNAGGKSAVMQLGTGGGKTATASAILGRATDRGIASLFLAHLDTLITDTADRLRASGIRCGYVQAGRPTDPDALVQVASMATLHSRGIRPPAGLVIVDECHRAMSASVRGILNHYPSAWLLGLTATPQRGDGKALGNVFEQLFCGPSNAWLTEHGYLVPCDVLAPAQFSDHALVDDPVAAYVKHVAGTRAIVFAASVEHAESLTTAFNAAGYPAACVVGETPREEREAVRQAVIDGAVKVLVGVGVFIEGFDLPAIETVILARSFTVTGSFLQAIGRGLRPSPATGKTRCTVIDLRGSVHLHGLADEDRRWSITGKAVVRVDTRTPLRRCTECLAIFRPANACPRCGHEAASAPRVERVLNRAEKLDQFSDLSQAERDRRYVARLLWVARSRMRKSGPAAWAWAVTQFEKRWGRKPEVAA